MFFSTYDDVFPAPHVKSCKLCSLLNSILVDMALNKGIRGSYYCCGSLYKSSLFLIGNYHLGSLY
jgi:hypothetical protein